LYFANRVGDRLKTDEKQPPSAISKHVEQSKGGSAENTPPTTPLKPNNKKKTQPPNPGDEKGNSLSLVDVERSRKDIRKLIGRKRTWPEDAGIGRRLGIGGKVEGKKSSLDRAISR